MIHIGFTGTRFGMTDAQDDSVRHLLDAMSGWCFGPQNMIGHHGDCVGSDAQFHEICRTLHFFVHLHPPTIQTDRAFCPADVVSPALPYMRRNREIVRAANYMLATPAALDQVPRFSGGTWRTIEMSQKAKKPLMIIHADGTTEGEWKL